QAQREDVHDVGDNLGGDVFAYYTGVLHRGDEVGTRWLSRRIVSKEVVGLGEIAPEELSITAKDHRHEGALVEREQHRFVHWGERAAPRMGAHLREPSFGEAVHLPKQEAFEQRVLARKGEVERTFRDPRLAGDLGDGGLVVAEADEALGRRIHESIISLNIADFRHLERY